MLDVKLTHYPPIGEIDFVLLHGSRPPRGAAAELVDVITAMADELVPAPAGNRL